MPPLWLAHFGFCTGDGAGTPVPDTLPPTPTPAPRPASLLAAAVANNEEIAARDDLIATQRQEIVALWDRVGRLEGLVKRLWVLLPLPCLSPHCALLRWTSMQEAPDVALVLLLLTIRVKIADVLSLCVRM